MPAPALTAALLLLALLAGCAHQPRGAAAPGSHPSRQGNGLVFAEAQLLGEDGSVLDVLRRGLVAMRVGPRTRGCPEVILRSRKTLFSSNDPGIYVDGALAGNTCILESINVADVERVEVYPMGVPSRPGYRANANGLIIVVLRRSAE